MCKFNKVTLCAWTVIPTTPMSTSYLFQEPIFHYLRHWWMRLLSTALLTWFQIWKVYNVGNGFQQISLLQQLKWHYSTPNFPRVHLCKLADVMGKNGHSLKALRTDFEKGGSNSTTVGLWTQRHGFFFYSKVTKIHRAILPKTKKIWPLYSLEF